MGAALATALVLGGCKVVSTAENEAMRERMSANFDAGRYAERLWTDQAVPYWTDAEQPLSTLIRDIRDDPQGAGRLHGRRAGDGSPWTFVVEARGVVEAVEPGRRGRIRLSLDGADAGITVQIGPVISGAALRDSLPFVHFNDFSNQLVYADVAHALTARALSQIGPGASTLEAGDAVEVGGVLVVPEDDADAAVLTPYRLERAPS